MQVSWILRNISQIILLEENFVDGGGWERTRPDGGRRKRNGEDGSGWGWMGADGGRGDKGTMGEIDAGLTTNLEVGTNNI